MTSKNLQPTLGKTVENWLGTDRWQTDMVLEVMEELANEQKIDLEEAPIDVVHKLADEAIEICQAENWFQGY